MAQNNSSNKSGSIGGFIAGVVITVIGLPFLSPLLLILGIWLIVRNRGAISAGKEKTSSHSTNPPRPTAAVNRPYQPPRPAPSAPSKSYQAVPRPVTPARPDPGRPTPRQSSSVSYNSYARDHQHITATGLSVEKRLEQLEVMKEAGLIDREEYQQRRQEILRSK